MRRLFSFFVLWLIAAPAWADEFADLLARTSELRASLPQDSGLTIKNGYCHLGEGYSIRSMSPCTLIREDLCNAEIGECGYREVYQDARGRVFDVDGLHDPVSEKFGFIDQKGDCVQPLKPDGRSFCFTQLPERPTN